VDTDTILAHRYRLHRLLGSGGIAQVYEARDTVLDEVVALKVLHPHLREEAPVLDAFRREVAISRVLVHPAIARIHDVGRDDASGAVYLAMEYLAGGDLKRRILTRGPLGPAEVRALGSVLAGALRVAHTQGIVHRDVKPHNILFDAKGKPRLADFGLARCGALFGLDGGQNVVGTPEYLAPESVESGYADARSDIYSLGVSLYEAACGRLPFAANSAYEALRQHAAAAPAPLARDGRPADEELERILLRALEKDPSRRFQTAEEMALVLGGVALQSSPAPEPMHPCPGCGAAVPDAFPYCFACRRAPLYLGASGGGPGTRVRVVVTGPGRPGDQISHDLRSRCLGLLRDLDADTRRLERHLPRYPFVLLDGLDPDGARTLVRALKAVGLEAAEEARGGGPSDVQVRRVFRKKDLSMSLRTVGLVLASSASVLPGLGASLGRQGIFAPVLALLAMGALAIPVVTVIRHRIPLVSRPKGGPSAVLARYLDLAPRLESAPLEALARRIVTRYEALARLERAVVAPQRPREGAQIARDTEPMVLRAADWLEACRGIEERLGRNDERGLYRHIGDEARPGNSGIEDTEQSIGGRREMERNRDILLDRLLSFSARLDRLLLTVAALGAHGAAEDMQDLTRAAEEVALVTGSIREIRDLV
jgi:hypothetical protein